MTTNPDASKERIDAIAKTRAAIMAAVEPSTDFGFVRLAGTYTDIREREVVALAADHARLQSENQLLSTRVEELDKWRIAFESLTPMGSEWVNDLPKCEDYIRQRMMSGQKAEMKLVHANRRVEELEGVLHDTLIMLVTPMDDETLRMTVKMLEEDIRAALTDTTAGR